MLFHVKRNPDSGGAMGWKWLDILAIQPTDVKRGTVHCDVYVRHSDGFSILQMPVDARIANNLQCAQELGYEYYMAKKGECDET